jgi:outer membrane receptor protein involved in Fe transport
MLRAQDYLDVATVIGAQKGCELRLGVNNLLDRQPPLVVSNTAAGDGPYNTNTYPTWYDPLGRYIFAGVSVAFKP